MGQYHIVVNLDKGQMIKGDGPKLWEHLANDTGKALVVLLASASNGDGAGDLTETDSSVIGLWRGDRIAFVGDYDDNTSYNTPFGKMSGAQIYDSDQLTDISGAVSEVVEAELGKFDKRPAGMQLLTDFA